MGKLIYANNCSLDGFIEDASAKEAAFSTIALAIGVLYALGAHALYRQR